MTLNRRGYTLVEVLVSMVLGALLMSAVLAAFLSSSRLMAWIGTRTDVDSSALLGLSALSGDVRESAYATLTIINSPPALSFRMEDPATTSLNSFSPVNYFSIYYFDAGQGAFVHKTWDGTDPANPDGLVPVPGQSPDPFFTGRMTAAQLGALVLLKNGTEHNVATNVVSVTCVPATYPVATLVDGIQVQLLVQKQAQNGQTCLETVQTMIQPRNHP